MGSATPSGIITRRYKAGSVIYFEGDKSENIFILKSGRVVLSYLRPETGEEIKEDVKAGEFFGVKSSLGKYPREETAQTLADTVVLVLSLADFEQIVLGNLQIVKKMLRVFSNQLRRIGRAVREVMGETAVANPQVELFRIGEYYYKNGKFEQALYAFKKYMSYYPDAKFAAQSMQLIKDIESGKISSMGSFSVDDYTMPKSAPEPSFSAPSDNLLGSSESDMTDFDFTDSSSPFGSSTFQGGEPGLSQVSDEMDDFLMDDHSLDDFSLGGAPSISDKYNDAVGAMVSARYSDAIARFQEIVETEDVPGSESEMYSDAHAELARAYLMSGKLKEAMNASSAALKKFPDGACAKKSLLVAGQVYQKAGNAEKASAYLKKVVSMPPKDEISAQAYALLTGKGV